MTHVTYLTKFTCCSRPEEKTDREKCNGEGTTNIWCSMHERKLGVNHEASKEKCEGWNSADGQYEHGLLQGKKQSTDFLSL